MPNRLAGSQSPYLLQHADNPVDWWEWGDEAFAEAARRDVPVFLSVGYAACHWCHVMAHESFEDDEVARVLAQGYVAVKVDREERPDVDAVYMAATTALTGQGGWPMTCLLTPGGDPFFAGTYLPRQHLLGLLDKASRVWREQRDQVLASGAHVAGRLREVTGPPAPAAVPDEVLDRAATRLRTDHDDSRGGFGGAPKFPPSMVLEFLLRHHARTGSADALAMVRRTCTAMARGGMYDQLAGGFARYSVDAAWVVPHFEKMLYDNALLVRVYAHLWRDTGDPLARRVAEESADFLVRDLGTPEGAFASALDADTVVDGHSHEGLTYAWTPAQLAEALGPQDGAAAAALLGVTPEGTFEHGTSTLRLLEDPDDPAWWADVRGRLLAARAQRPQPARDDKVVTAWNGLAVAGLADAGSLLGRPDLVEAAATAAEHVLATHDVEGVLRRTSRGGVPSAAPGVLDDHADLAEGLLALHRATGEARWLAAAGDLLERALARFVDTEGLVHDTAHDAPALFTRPASRSDNAEPTGASALAGALLTYAALTGSARHREAADRALAACGSVAASEPRFAGWALAVAEAAVAGPLQVAVVGSGPGAEELLAEVLAASSPGLVHVAGEPDSAGVPLLADRPLVDGSPAAYVCRGFVCDRPVTTPEDLAAALHRA
ncbi:thioredoxin domain-containing protein [Phycicoccus sonneratiae]|uniref:Thioredoxin domain-containing protein n=1 Tax=Phycicoccus sonneratiae TaxID=2807628 RepID=A0ABS2CMQ4_9MICO|nr:thioredoxin domain-containing protein [Phycicoccus sonneraticus]MBM6400374.1 thioredoxin domain-containing protein [Phycicoccus sonneraticus]